MWHPDSPWRHPIWKNLRHEQSSVRGDLQGDATRAGFAMCWAPSNTNAHSVSGDFAHKHHFMKVSFSRHAIEQRSLQTRTTRASALLPVHSTSTEAEVRMRSQHTSRLLAAFAAGV